MHKKIVATVAAAAAATVVSLGVVPQAAAYENNDINNAQIVNYKPVYREGELIHVTASNLEPNTSYIMGQCSWESYSFKYFPWAYVPACVSSGTVNVTTDSNGNLDGYFPAISGGRNAHQSLGGKQPAAIDFSFVHAEIDIVKDHHQGFKGRQSADTTRTFTVTK